MEQSNVSKNKFKVKSSYFADVNYLIGHFYTGLNSANTVQGHILRHL